MERREARELVEELKKKCESAERLRETVVKQGEAILTILSRVDALEEENKRLKRVVDELDADIDLLKEERRMSNN